MSDIRLAGTHDLTGIDTNVLLRALVEDDPVQTPLAQDFLRGLNSTSAGFIAHITLVELSWTLRRTYRMTDTEVLAIIRSLIETESLEFEDGESVVRALALAEEGADFADALIQASGELFGTTGTVTFDRHAAARLGWRDLAAV